MIQDSSLGGTEVREERGMRWKSEENEERLLIMLNTKQRTLHKHMVWTKTFKKYMINKEVKKKKLFKDVLCEDFLCPPWNP